MDVFTDDNTLPENSKIKEWHDLSVKGAGMVGCPCRVDSRTMKGYFEDAGFVNVHVTDYKWPIGPWPADRRLKEAGALAMVSMLEELTGLSVAVFTRILGWSTEELEVFLIDVKKEWKSRGIHGYWPMYVLYPSFSVVLFLADFVNIQLTLFLPSFVIYGQKPESAV
jgi:hypothetical protein